VSIKDAIAFRELQQQAAELVALLEELVEEHATQKGRLTALEGATTAGCATCAARRTSDAARQQRRRHRQAGAAEKSEHV
jgi:hypothetical protein